MRIRISALMALLTGAWGVFAGQEAILLEQPAIWYAFDNIANGVNVSSGSSNFSITLGSTYSQAANADGVGGYIRGNASGAGPYYGSGLPLGTGSWTLYARMKVGATADKIELCLGSATTGNHGLVVSTAGNDVIRAEIRTGLTTVETTFQTTVPNSSTEFHDYAFAFNREDRTVAVYVDAEYKGSFPFENYAQGNTAWQWFSIYGGYASTNLTPDGDGMIDDYRFYTRILTTDELAALKRGRTPVSVYGGYLTNSDAMIWKNVQIKDIVRVRAREGGTSIGNAPTVPFYQEQSATSLSVQMQKYGDSRYNKVMWMQLTQSGADVLAKMLKVGYLEVSGYSAAGVNGTIANDFGVNWVNGGTIAVGNQTKDYGLTALTADTLYDENAAVAAGTDGTFAAVASWQNGNAPAAAKNVSFAIGSGTMQNDLPAGTSFGRLAFGLESGSWTVSGNAGRFAEVINASKQPQRITMPLSYATDFKPEAWAELTFTDLTVTGGVFQPIGTGEIVLAGESTLESVSLTENVRTCDRPEEYPNGSTGWASSVGYFTANKQQTHSLRVPEGGHATIGKLQTNLAGQRRLVTILDGSFTITDTIVLGNDAVLAFKNGTTEFKSAYQTTSSLGVNSWVYVHDTGKLVIPSFTAASGLFFCLDGVMESDAISSTAALSFSKNGTLNVDTIIGTGTSTFDGVTVGPRKNGLNIGTPLVLGTDSSTVSGVTFRTSTPDGVPSAVTIGATMTHNAAVPFCVMGGGTFTYAKAEAVTLPEVFTLGDNTTADFSAATSLAFQNAVTLGAGSRLILPGTWSGEAFAFAQKPTLPDEGVASIVVSPTAELAAGTYTLAAEGFVPADLDHLAFAFRGLAASTTTATLAVDENGALKVTVAKTAQPTGPKSSKITFAGYTGNSTLVNFPALIQLPAGVPGFAYGDAATDGADIYFTDASGERIPHEIDSWRTDGSSYLWVRVPELADASTYVTMHWGGGTANVPVLGGDPKVFTDDYMGVWHFSSLGSSTPDATANALTMTVSGTAGNIKLADSPIGSGVQQTASGVNLSTPNSVKWLQYASTKKLSVSGWFKVTSKTANMRLVSCKSDWTSAGGFELTSRGTAGTEFLVGGANKSQYTQTGVASYYDNWQHYTVIYDGTLATPESRLYYNGVLVKTVTGADYSLQSTTLPLTFGSMSTAPTSNAFLGYQDEIRLSKSVRSADWIYANYLTMKSPTTFAVASPATADGAGLAYDFRPLTTANTVAVNTGVEPVYAGIDTTLTYPGEGALVIEPGKKATVPSWNGELFNTGYLKLTGVSTVMVPPRTGVTEYAGTHTLSFDDAPTPLVFSGDVRLTGEYSVLQYRHAPLTVSGGTTTFCGIVRIGERNKDVGSGIDYGGILNVTGGRVVADITGTLDYSGYTERPMQINVTGGSFEVPVRAWWNSSEVYLTTAAVNVGGTGTFAPAYFGQRNSGTITGIRLYVHGTETGALTAPETVPNWVAYTAESGTPYLKGTMEADVDYQGPITIEANATLTVAGTPEAVPYIVFHNVIDGEGTLAVENAILDLTENPDFEDFGGTVVVRAGGVLILPSNEEPTFPIQLEEGARVIATVNDTPDVTAAFLGALAGTPSAGTATIEFDVPTALLQGSIYTLSTGTLPAGAADSLRVVFTGMKGESTEGTIALSDDGKVEVTITASENSGGELVWAGATDETVTSSKDVLAWTKKDETSGGLFAFLPNVPLWFTDAAALKTVTVAENVKAGPVTVNANQDYVLRGSGQINTPTFTKQGAGQVTLNGGGFANLQEIVVEEGTVQLGETLTKAGLGSTETKIIVKDGATFDLNTQSNSSGSAPTVRTYDATFYIEGEGVDGKGAVWDHNAYATVWGCQFGRMELVGDAVIGSTCRLDFRKPSDAVYTGRPTLTGEGRTLTSRARIGENVGNGLNFVNADINIGKLVVDTGATIGIEGDTVVNAAEGIELKENARLHYWNASGKKAPIVVTGQNARLRANGGTDLQDAPLTVNADASLYIYGDQTLNITNTITNAGVITITNAYPQITGPLVNQGGTYAIAGTGANVTFTPNGVTGPFDLTLSGGGVHFDEFGRWDAAPMTITQTGGELWWGRGANGDYPAIAADQLTVDITGGTLAFHAKTSQTLPGVFAGSTPADLWICNSAVNQTTTLSTGTYAASSLLKVASASYAARLEQIGGELNVKGLMVYAASVTNNNKFVMNGGLFTMGASGFSADTDLPQREQVDLASGTYQASANHSVAKYGMLLTTGNSLLTAGALTIDTNGKTITHEYTTHTGASDVTVTGGGAYNTSITMQGVELGKWTIDGNTSANLTGMAGFMNGLDVMAGSSASVGISGDNLVEYSFLKLGFDAALAYAATGTFSCVASHLKHFSQGYASGAPVNTCAFAARGQFYVPEDQAGTWTLAGVYDDNIGLVMDGALVFSNKTWNTVARTTVEVSAGWHDFALVTYDGTGGQGVRVGNWPNQKCLGWLKGSSSSTEANDYNAFDTSTLQMRVKDPVLSSDGIYRQRLAGTGYGTYDALKALTPESFPAGTVEQSLKATLNTKIATTQQGSALRYTGYFVVQPDKAGEWTFDISYDDSCIVYIDGTEVAHNTVWSSLGTSTATISAGLHAFEIRTADGSGGYGPDAKGINNGFGVAVTRPGDTAKQAFDERTLTFTSSALVAQKGAQAGLGGVSTINGVLQSGTPWTDLTNRWCPIYGTLAGAGTLKGPFRFVGENNTWRLGVDFHKVTTKVTFESPDANTLADLKTIELVCSQRPMAPKMVVGPALGLTAEKAAEVTVKAPVPAELRKADGPEEYEFKATVEDGQLVLINVHGSGGTVLFLR